MQQHERIYRYSNLTNTFSEPLSTPCDTLSADVPSNVTNVTSIEADAHTCNYNAPCSPALLPEEVIDCNSEGNPEQSMYTNLMSTLPAYSVVKSQEQWDLEAEIRAVQMTLQGVEEGRRKARRREPVQVKNPIEKRIDACVYEGGSVNYAHVLEYLKDLQGPLRQRCNINVFTEGIICFAS